MAGKKRRRTDAVRSRPSGAEHDPPPEVVAVLEELQRVLATPLAGLFDDEEERAEATELTRQAAAVPAMGRLREVVAFMARGRTVTQAGNLKGADALALAQLLAPGTALPEQVRTMDDVPDAAHAFRWAAAADLLAWRGTKVVAGPSAPDLAGDPLAAYFNASMIRLQHGLLDGFRQGWRKAYVEFLDAGTPALLVALGKAGGRNPLAAVEEAGWVEVAEAYGYRLDDEAERAHVAGYVGDMVDELADLGAMVRDGADVVLTDLGRALAAIIDITDLGDDDDLDDDEDLVDTDAESLLWVCLEEMEPGEATEHLRAWCKFHDADDAAGQLCSTMLDDDEPGIWELGFEALAMIDPSVAVPAVRKLRDHPDLGPLAGAWLDRHGNAR